MTDRNEKRAKFETTSNKSGKKLLIPGIITAIALMAVAAWALTSPTTLPGGFATVTAENDAVRFLAAEFDDGKARFYRYQSKQGPINFFVVKSSDGIIRSAFDTCDVCYKALKGYTQEGNQMVCNNCGQKFRTDRVNDVKGGCNPAPLNRQKVGNEIVIHVADLETGARYFHGLK